MSIPHTLLTAALLATAPAALAQITQHSPNWTSAGNGISDDHYTTNETVLTKSSVANLAPLWTFAADGEIRSTPTLYEGRLFLTDTGGYVDALDPNSGAVLWKTNLATVTGRSGAYSRNSPAIAGAAVIVGDETSATVFALSRSTGKLLWSTVLDTKKTTIITGSPIAYGNLVYAGVSSGQEGLTSTNKNYTPDFRGSVAAMNLSDGHIVWQTYTVPLGYSGGAVWGSNFALDHTRSLLYIGSGNNYSVPASVSACQQAATTPTALAACLSPNDHIDSILALNTATGAIQWSQRFTNADTFTLSCTHTNPATPCPTPAGLDTDFGSAPNLFNVNIAGKIIAAVGAGQKSGAFYAMDRATGQILWSTQVAPYGLRGGILWGTATDGKRIYVPASNSAHVSTTLIPSGQRVNGGFWSALDVNTGKILWQTPTVGAAQTVGGKTPPAGATAEAEGSLSVANSVVFGEDTGGYLVALDATTGKILYQFQSGGSAVSAPAIVSGILFWPSGAANVGTTNNKLYALTPTN